MLAYLQFLEHRMDRMLDQMTEDFNATMLALETNRQGTVQVMNEAVKTLNAGLAEQESILRAHQAQVSRSLREGFAAMREDLGNLLSRIEQAEEKLSRLPQIEERLTRLEQDRPPAA